MKKPGSERNWAYSLLTFEVFKTSKFYTKNVILLLRKQDFLSQIKSFPPGSFQR